MEQKPYSGLGFDEQLAIKCADAFSESTGLGCLVSDTEGHTLHEAGYGCQSCAMCTIAGTNKENCNQAHIYGMTEAERFGGKYIYFCPMGLTCFVSPIVGQHGSEAKITVGPFLMVEPDDYLSIDLATSHHFTPGQLRQAAEALADIPEVTPQRVDALSTLLFMAVGFMNNVSAAGRMLDTQNSGQIQGQVSAYIAELKMQSPLSIYPLELEEKLIHHIASSNRDEAQVLLNQLLGHILLNSGGNLLRIKVRVQELFVLMSRAAIRAGASTEYTFTLSCNFFEKAQAVYDIDKLCFLITEVMENLINSVFSQMDMKHIDVMHKSVQYIRQNYSQKITMEEVARQVYLSPSYFSKLFKKEMGVNFNTWLNRFRIEKSKKLLMQNMRMVDIAILVGFEDQSYFTKVFKRVTGVSPNRYRETGGRT